jgi:putative transposase
MRYVELNPVRARLVPAAAQYEWSSARAHLGGEDAMSLLAQEEWKRCWTSDEWARILERDDEERNDIREATYGGRPLGSSEFVAELEKFLGRRLKKGSPGRPKNRPTTAAAGEDSGMSFCKADEGPRLEVTGVNDLEHLNPAQR